MYVLMEILRVLINFLNGISTEEYFMPFIKLIAELYERNFILLCSPSISEEHLPWYLRPCNGLRLLVDISLT